MVDTGWVSESHFLAGHGTAQAMPGPLFTFAAFLGAVSTPGPGGVLGALIALLAIFLRGFLLLVGVLPIWSAMQAHPIAQAAMRGAGAPELCLALACFVLHIAWRTPPWIVVIVAAAGGVLLALAA